jgi:hypothetical protein
MYSYDERLKAVELYLKFGKLSLRLTEYQCYKSGP